MSALIFGIIFIILIAITAVAATYAIKSERGLANNPSFSTDQNLQDAHKYLLIAGIVGWTTIGIIIILIILYFVFGAETILYTGSIVAIILGLLSIALAATVGILSTIGAIDMRKSPNFTNQGQDKDAYDDAIIAAVCGVGSVGLLLVILVIYWVQRYRKSAREAKAIKNQEQLIFELQKLKLTENVQVQQQKILEGRLQNIQLAEQIDGGPTGQST